MKITIQVGWWDESQEQGLRTVQGGTIEDAVSSAAALYPECLDSLSSLKENIDHVDEINGEGNYHAFVFRVIDIRS